MLFLHADSNPKLSLINIGGFILQELHTDAELDTNVLYERVNAQLPLSFTLFMYALDWLYLVKVIDYDNGVFRLCTSEDC